ncbi:hypothetical protein [Streptomyces tropicalis]|uniref:Uncharacterized protein n=1 Tax=Streptomyces tropicalis TaxID=3034234 RepID=A0ABT6AC76_9ACTN|nr:hypothetical protein [Streptomyces tropicalis]MDF3302262.1 hypothetical protein [Streptomyces tropicalis]
MPGDPYAVLRALLRAEAARTDRAAAGTPTPPPEALRPAGGRDPRPPAASEPDRG